MANVERTVAEFTYPNDKHNTLCKSLNTVVDIRHSMVIKNKKTIVEHQGKIPHVVVILADRGQFIIAEHLSTRQ